MARPRTKVFVSFVLVAWSSCGLSAQELGTSVTNSLRYGTGNELNLMGEQDKKYFENLTDVRFLYDHLTAGFRLEYSKPIEYGLPYQGLRKKYIEFQYEGLNARVGDLYALFSHGLTLNLFENRPLAYDTGLEGLRVQYKNDWFNILVVGGDLDYVEPLTVTWPSPRREAHSIRGGTTEVKVSKSVSIGGSLVWSKSTLPAPGQSAEEVHSWLPEAFLSVRTQTLDFYAAFCSKWTGVGEAEASRGSGTYLSASHSGDGYGITFEYKDYGFDIVDPLQRSDAFRPTRMLAFQNPPIVHKEHSWTSLTRYPHIVDFNDEGGFQFDAFYALAPSTTLSFNTALSSRHYEYIFDRGNLTMLRLDQGKVFLPSSSQTRSPFWEAYVDVEYYFSASDSYLKLAFDTRSETQYVVLDPGLSVRRRVVSFPIRLQYMLSESWNIRFTLEQQWVLDTSYPTQERFYNQYIGLQFAAGQVFSAGLRVEATSNKNEVGGRTSWILGEASYRLGSSNTLEVSYGAERGGQVCSNGICRWVSPFRGFRFSILSHF